MRWSQTIGVEQPLPGNGAFQRTFSTSHFVGKSRASVLPLSCGPRHRGRLAWSWAAAKLAALSRQRSARGPAFADFSQVKDFMRRIERKIGANDEQNDPDELVDLWIT